MLPKIFFVIFIYILFGVALSCDIATFEDGKFKQCRTLDANFDLYWRIEKGKEIFFGISIKNNQGGWVGLGLSENGGMKGADIFVAQKNEQGNYEIEDRFATEYAEPQRDYTHSDLTLLSATETPASSTSSSSSTSIIFKRKLDTCDPEQDRAITNNSIQVIYAYGLNKLHYHGPHARGRVSINFFEGDNGEDVLPAGEEFETFDLLTAPFVVPAASTTYACTARTLPHDKNYHIVRISPLVTSPLVHHVVGYLCYGPPPEDVPLGSVDCYDFKDYCMDGPFYLIWGLGEDDVVYNQDYALPMGGSKHVYVRLETHYNNPSLIPNVTDSSGLRLTYTSKLRKYDIGMVALGQLQDGIKLPPHEASIDVTNECQDVCTRRVIPDEGVKIIAIAPHMHLTGSRFWIQHIRDGVELPNLLHLDYYDFGLQQQYTVNRVILPGDRLITHCVYDTTDRNEMTMGGSGSESEMCYGFILFYPDIPTFSACIDLKSIGVPELENYTMCGGFDDWVPNVYPRPAYKSLETTPSKVCEASDSDVNNYTHRIAVGLVILCVGCAVAFTIYYAVKKDAPARVRKYALFVYNTKFRAYRRASDDDDPEILLEST